jgi:hypothetical protein
VARAEEGRRLLTLLTSELRAVAVAEGTSGMLILLGQQRSARVVMMTIEEEATLELANNDESKDGYVLWRHRKIVVR